ncbi:hypothetical protein AAG906_010336 [Vitis piasezkii]
MEFFRLNLLAPLLLSLSLLLPLTLAVDVTYCGRFVRVGDDSCFCAVVQCCLVGNDSYKNADYDVTVQGVEISPYPVVRGQITANAGETITGGKLVIDVSYFGWHIHSETHDLCEESSCPVSSGDFVISHTQVLPGFTPPLLSLINQFRLYLTVLGASLVLLGYG